MFVEMAELADLSRRHRGMSDVASVQASIASIGGMISTLGGYVTTAASATDGGAATSIQADTTVAQIANSTPTSDGSLAVGSPLQVALNKLYSDAFGAAPTANAAGIATISTTLAADYAAVQSAAAQPNAFTAGAVSATGMPPFVAQAQAWVQANPVATAAGAAAVLFVLWSMSNASNA